MKPIQRKRPVKPANGDTLACKRYASYCAANSKNPKQTLSLIWIDFILSSFLGANDKEVNV